MVECRPVQTSAVYVLNAAQFDAVPPPSPPSPVTPQNIDLCEPDPLDLSSPSRADLAQQPDGTEVETPEDDLLSTAVHVLSTEAAALNSLAHLYATDVAARRSFRRAVDLITRHGGRLGKLVMVGVGKSGHVARKLAATFNSLGAVRALFLHPTEALHGDLGALGPHDTCLLVSFSGRTPELLALVPYLPSDLPLIALTGGSASSSNESRPHRQNDDPEDGKCEGEADNGNSCAIADLRPDLVVLPAPVGPVSEADAFGVPAPTASTTVALALGDALALVCSRAVHGAQGDPSADAAAGNDASRLAEAFARNHPGGAIGAALAGGSNAVDSPHARPIRAIAANRPSSQRERPLQHWRMISSTPAATIQSIRQPPRQPQVLLRDLAVPWSRIAVLTAPEEPDGSALSGGDLLLVAYASASGWVRVPTCAAACEKDPSSASSGADGAVNAAASGDHVASPSRLRRLTTPDLSRPLDRLLASGLLVPRDELVVVAGGMDVKRAGEWAANLLVGGGGGPDGSGGPTGSGQGDGEDERGPSFGPDTILGVVDNGEMVGVLEMSQLLHHESLDRQRGEHC